jgi:hypothetical protein
MILQATPRRSAGVDPRLAFSSNVSTDCPGPMRRLPKLSIMRLPRRHRQKSLLSVALQTSYVMK